MANLSKPKCIIHLYCYGVRDELVNTCMGSLQTKCFRPCIRMMFWGIRQFIFGSRIFPICITFNWWLFFNVTLVDLSLLVCVTDRSVLTVPFFFLIGIHPMQGCTATTRHGVTRKKKKSTKKITGYRKSV